MGDYVKPAGEWCRHCEPSEGCTIYEDRPEDPCRTFVCTWLGVEPWPIELDPVKTQCVVLGELVTTSDGRAVQVVRVHENRPRAFESIAPALRAMWDAGAAICVFDPGARTLRVVGWHPATNEEVTFMRAPCARDGNTDVPTITIDVWERFRFSKAAIKKEAAAWLAKHTSD